MVAPLGFILKADGVSGRTLTDASWTGGTDADYSVNKRQLLKPRFSMASIAMFLACVRRLRAASRPGARLVIAKTDAAEAYRRLRLQRQGVELYTSDGKLYGNVAVPFGEAPSAAAFSRGALAFGTYLFARVQARAARGDLPLETAAALARYEAATVIDDTIFAIEGCAAAYLHEEISQAHAVWGLTMAPKKLHEFVFRTTGCFLGVTFDTELDVLYISGAKRAKWLPFLEGVARERGPDGGAGATTRAVWEKTVGILGHVAYVHPLCMRYLHHCYRRGRRAGGNVEGANQRRYTRRARGDDRVPARERRAEGSDAGADGLKAAPPTQEHQRRVNHGRPVRHDAARRRVSVLELRVHPRRPRVRAAHQPARSDSRGDDCGHLAARRRHTRRHCFPSAALRRVTLAGSPVARFAGPRSS